jgi:hypothetical protein
VSKAEATDPNVIDTIAFDHDDHDLLDHHSESPFSPIPIPAQGRRPRLKRPSEAVHRRDSLNTYKSDVDIHRHAMANADRKDDRFSKKHEIGRLLAKTARHHAPRLSRYRDDAVAGVMEREVLPDARFIAGSLPLDVRSGVLAKFTEVLWDEIKHSRRFTKT